MICRSIGKHTYVQDNLNEIQCIVTENAWYKVKTNYQSVLSITKWLQKHIEVTLQIVVSASKYPITDWNTSIRILLDTEALNVQVVESITKPQLMRVVSGLWKRAYTNVESHGKHTM